MTKIIFLIAGLVFFWAGDGYSKSSSDLIGGTTKKPKATSGISNKAPSTKQGAAQTNSLTGAKSQNKSKKAKGDVLGTSKKGATDPLGGKSGSKLR